MSTNISSRFWLKLASDNPARNNATDLPPSLLLKLKQWLNRNKTEKHILRIQCTLDEKIKFCFDKNQPAVHTDKLQIEFHAQIHHLTNTLLHSQCEWYHEAKLARRPLTAPDRSCRSLVFHPGEQKWVCETLFSPGRTAFDAQLYTFRVLYDLSLRNCKVAARFLGVVRDARERIVAFMIDLPEKGFLATIMEEADRVGRPISRSRRRRWCRELLLAVAEVHRQRNILGMLGLRFQGVFTVDATDRLVIWALFRPQLLSHHRLKWGTVPPEHRYTNDPINHTPQSDLFQLGLVLWRIAGNKTSEGSVEFCRSVDCRTPSNEYCGEPHADPLALEMCSADYDQDMMDIINDCRSEDPQKRLPSADLLRMLPDVVSGDNDRDATSTIKCLDPDQFQRIYGLTIAGCNKCGQPCTERYYHCEICHYNDFDLCAGCFNQGIHCKNNEHRLLEWYNHSPTARYHGHVNCDGIREVTTSEPDDEDGY